MGVCQTGRHPLVLAAQRPIAAALVWYGAASQREWQVNARYPVALEQIMARIDCPVLGIFGEADHLISLGNSTAFAGRRVASAKYRGKRGKRLQEFFSRKPLMERLSLPDPRQSFYTD